MRFRSALILAALCVAAPAAIAQVTNSDIEKRLTADGYKIVEIERYTSKIEVKAWNKAGACVELYLDPTSGNITKTESDDRCNGRSSGRRGGRGGDDSGRHGANHN